MAYSPRLYQRPLASQPSFPALSVSGTPAKYTPSSVYAGYLTISGAVGKCKVDVVSSSNLPNGAQIYVDNVLMRVVIRWPAFTTVPQVDQVVRNGDFSDGLSYWNPQTPQWAIGNGQGGAGGWPSGGPCLAWGPSASGEGFCDGQTVPCNPGQLINLGCQVQQGASSKNNAGGCCALVFMNGNGEESEFRSEFVSDGNNRAWSETRVLRAAPADTVTVKPRLVGYRKRESKEVYFDHVTWDHAYTEGNTGVLPVGLSLRVSDSAGRSALWSGNITAQMYNVPYRFDVSTVAAGSGLGLQNDGQGLFRNTGNASTISSIRGTTAIPTGAYYFESTERGGNEGGTYCWAFVGVARISSFLNTAFLGGSGATASAGGPHQNDGPTSTWYPILVNRTGTAMTLGASFTRNYPVGSPSLRQRHRLIVASNGLASYYTAIEGGDWLTVFENLAGPFAIAASVRGRTQTSTTPPVGISEARLYSMPSDFVYALPDGYEPLAAVTSS